MNVRKCLTAVLATTACLLGAWTATNASIPHFSAAIPTLPAAGSELTACVTDEAIALSFTRAATPHVLVSGSAALGHDLDLAVRWLPVLDLAPVFLGIEIGPARVTGLITVSLGPASIDLGRTWFQPERWAIVQLSMHPRLTAYLALEEAADRFRPSVGCRLFPLASARWELGFRLGTTFAVWTGWRFQ